jgi:hypothetical protein
MLIGRLALISTVVLVSAFPAIGATRARRSASRTPVKHSAKAKSQMQFQRAMDDERAAQIQTALIKAGYLTGAPSGHWDADSEAAMEKLQADNGWQTKLVPDSRALIKIGLGPSTTPKPDQTSPVATLSQP